MEVIGYVDRSWKPPRKSKVELQIDREDDLYWARKETEFVYVPVRQKLEFQTAKHLCVLALGYASMCNPFNV